MILDYFNSIYLPLSTFCAIIMKYFSSLRHYFFVVLRFELRAYILRYSANPFL
jgi:hypothetical protein